MEPKTDFSELPVLQSVFRANREGTVSPSSVILSNTYDIEGLNPAADTNDRTTSGAIVKVFHGSRTYTFAETTQVIRPIDPAKKPVTVYRSRDFRIGPGDSTKIVVTLANGRRLEATCRMPTALSFETNYDISNGLSTLINDYDYGPVYQFYWTPYRGERHLHFISIQLIYAQVLDSVTVVRSKQVPIRLVQKNGRKEPLYLTFTYQPQFDLTFEALDYAMESVGAGVADKSTITIRRVNLAVTEFDLHLSRFYSSTNSALDSYTIRTDEFTYSNIQGGIGIYGAAYDNVIEIPLQASYARKYGYNIPF